MSMSIKETVVETALLIRRPAAAVYQAFTDPAITSRFWFTKGSARLMPGARVRWDWEMYGAHTWVRVKAIDPSKRILIDWGAADERPTEVEWRFTARAADQTFVEVTNRGFDGTPDERVAKALDAMGGFSLVLAGAKAWLEHGIALNLVPDRFPDAVVEGWTP